MEFFVFFVVVVVVFFLLLLFWFYFSFSLSFFFRLRHLTKVGFSMMARAVPGEGLSGPSRPLWQPGWCSPTPENRLIVYCCCCKYRFFSFSFSL